MLALLAAGLLLASIPGPLTLDSALSAARARNLALPIAAQERAAASEDVRIADAERFLTAAIEGDFVYAPRGAYDPAATNLGEERLQLLARQPIWSGGETRAHRRRARAALRASDARVRMAERDLVLEVTSAFATLVAAREEVQARGHSVDRLDRYVSLLEQRRAAGDPVSLDLHRTRVRRSRAIQNRGEALQRAENARIELNLQMGGDPETPVDAVWSDAAAGATRDETFPAPDLAAAEANLDAARADLEAARAVRRPHLQLLADAGFWGTDTGHWGTASDRLQRDRGASLTLALQWPLFDLGLTQATVARARANVVRAQWERTAAERLASGFAAKALSARENLRTRLATASQALPDARDAYLEAESRYRGGVATAVDVLDAEADEVDAEIAIAATAAELRIAEALARRWGSE